MRIDCALLCDFVTVREGLLHILGGGVSRLSRPEFPAPIGVGMAVRVVLHPTEADRTHHLEGRLLAEDGAPVASFAVDFSVELDATQPIRAGEMIPVAVPVLMHDRTLPAPGAYSFELLIDGNHHASVPFVAEHHPVGLDFTAES